MQIQSLKMSNFLGYQFQAFEFPKPVNLIAGPNGSGKTAIHDALLIALTEAKPRGISAKKDFHTLITEGAKKGHVEAVVDGEKYVKSLNSGNFQGDKPEIHDFLPYVLTAHQFAALAPEARRKFLERMVGVSLEPEQTQEELEKRGCDSAVVEEILPLLLEGFKGAEKHARAKATELKGEWKGVTGETWGAKKGATWKCEGGKGGLNQEEQEIVDQEIPRLEERLAELNAIAGKKGGMIIEAPCPSCGADLVVREGKILHKAELPDISQPEAFAEAKEIKEELDDLRRIKSEKRWRQGTTQKAAEAHDQIEAWLFLAEQLSPEGVPRLLFDKARGPVNYRLARWAKVFGSIDIDPFGNILFNGRQYELCSESQKWICDAFVAEAIAHTSELKVLLLDRMDVLDIPNRGRFMQWLMKIAADYDTVIVTATMKSAPNFGDKAPIHTEWVGPKQGEA